MKEFWKQLRIPNPIYLWITKRKIYSWMHFPPSLLEAIRVFVVARAIRNLRGQQRTHCTMMVNVSRFVNIQKQVKEIISFYLENLKCEVRYNYSVPEATALKNQSMQELKKAYDTFYSNSQTSWADVQGALANAIDPIKIFNVNSKSDEALDYKKVADAGASLTALAIGGLSLSRGLTLEGLTVSYMYRNTKMYDTLMQMGRWFGYRPGYQDLCKVWLSEDSQDWYEHITEATEELRSRINQMRRDGLNPTDFGLYVRAHPDVLTVTAMNKMRDTQTRLLEITLSGELKETYIVPAENNITVRNQGIVREFYNKLCSEFSDKKRVIDNTIFWDSVNWETVHDFISDFRYHRALQPDKMAVIEYLKKVSTKYPEMDVAYISLKKEKLDSSKFALDDNAYILCQERAIGTKAGPEANVSIPKETPYDEGYYITGKQRVASRGVEIIGLSPEKIKAANSRGGKNEANIADKNYRFVRGKPLLMVHVLDLIDKSVREPKSKPLVTQVPAIGIAFPGGDYDRVAYVVNKVWLQLHKQESFDNPDDEDDYDE